MIPKMPSTTWPSNEVFQLLMTIIILLLVIGNVLGLIFYTIGWREKKEKPKKRAIKLFLIGSSMWLAPIIIGLIRYAFEIITGTEVSRNLMLEALLMGMVIAGFFTIGPGLIFYFLAIISSILGLILYMLSWSGKNEKLRGYAIKLFLFESIMLLILIILLVAVRILVPSFGWIDTGN